MPYSDAKLPIAPQGTSAGDCADFDRASVCSGTLSTRLTASFEYVVQAQLEEFERLYGKPPARIDGHHHMHLCANVLCQESAAAWLYRSQEPHLQVWRKNVAEQALSTQRKTSAWHGGTVLRIISMTCIPLSRHARLRKIFALGARFNVEIETHPIRDEEYDF